ncbi:MAG TPA: DUF3105 domain-containing protein [Propionibacteriaceae bacterium]
MAKTPSKKAAPSGGNRRDRLASFETARKKEQRNRTIRLLALCVVLALALLSYPVYLVTKDYQARNATIGEVGAAASAAGCDPVAENAATGNQEHVADGTKVTYAQTPPDSGAHYNSPAPFTKRFYAESDRPAVETLVHNLEHGYTIAWYRATAPQDQIDALEAISKTFGGDDTKLTNKFIAAPWAESDGAGFPEGKNVVLAHWYADPADPTATAQQKGVRQACTSASGPVVADFMAKYPYTDSPEPLGG